MKKLKLIKDKNEIKNFPHVVINSVFIILCVCCIYPVLIMISSSLSSENAIYTKGYGIFPTDFTLDAYKVAFYNPVIVGRSYIITITVTIIGTITGLWLVSTIGYVLSKRNFVLKKGLSYFVFFTMLFNGGLVPSYILMVRWLGLKDNLLNLILPGLVSAWYVLLMKGFFSGIPESLPESAKIDGAGELTIFTRIILPISKPSIATVGLFLTLQYWNDWFNCLLYINNEKLYTLQYMLVRVAQSVEFLNNFLSSMVNSEVSSKIQIPTLTARFSLCIVAAGPMLFIFVFFQKYFVKGLTVGSIKG